MSSRKYLHLVTLFLLASPSLSLAEEGDGTVSAQPEVWSQPEQGQTRTDPSTVTADPQPSQSAPAPAQGPQPEVWSSPEPGRARDTGPVWNPQPAYPPPPPGYYSRRRYYPAPPPPDNGKALTEIGFSLGQPSILNFNLGYWGSREFPLLLRFSGMYYGTTRGAQVDVGYVISRNGWFKQYFALSAISYQQNWNYSSVWTDITSSNDIFYGVGPTYGVNWRGLSLQIGVAFGNDQSTVNYSSGTSWSGATVPGIDVTDKHSVYADAFISGRLFVSLVGVNHAEQMDLQEDLHDRDDHLLSASLLFEPRPRRGPRRGGAPDSDFTRASSDQFYQWKGNGHPSLRHQRPAGRADFSQGRRHSGGKRLSASRRVSGGQKRRGISLERQRSRRRRVQRAPSRDLPRSHRVSAQRR